MIGLTGDDLHIDAEIALGAATLALPVAAAEPAGVLAVAVLSCERVLAELDGWPTGTLGERSRTALAQVPQAAAWATRFTGAVPARLTSAKRFRTQAAPTIVRNAAVGVAHACVLNWTSCSATCSSSRSTPARDGRPGTRRPSRPEPRGDGRGRAGPAHPDLRRHHHDRGRWRLRRPLPAHRIPRYLRRQGYRVIPVNPARRRAVRRAGGPLAGRGQPAGRRRRGVPPLEGDPEIAGRWRP